MYGFVKENEGIDCFMEEDTKYFHGKHFSDLENKFLWTLHVFMKTYENFSICKSYGVFWGSFSRNLKEKTYSFVEKTDEL